MDKKDKHEKEEAKHKYFENCDLNVVKDSIEIGKDFKIVNNEDVYENSDYELNREFKPTSTSNENTIEIKVQETSKNTETKCDKDSKETALNKIVCEMCCTSFRTKKALKKHTKRVHENKRPFCSICSKNVSNLKIHIKRVHENRKPPHNACSSASKSKHHLKPHVSRICGKKQPFMCESCRKRFATRFKLKEHTQRWHANIANR